MTSPAQPDPPAPSAAPYLPARAGALEELQTAARSCRGCHLYESARQTVFGTGPTGAEVAMVGEQPGDVEDRVGRPFVGPAGRLLDRALAQAGLERDRLYVTNAVKHFKFVPAERGRRRIHQRPTRTEILACRPWLAAELSLLQPRIVVAMGATAVQALLGPAVKVTQVRGELMAWPQPAGPAAQDLPGAQVLATIHPSAVLRASDREASFAGLVADLAVVAQAVA